MNRSLVIAPQWIGDAVMTEPWLRMLHARGETITVAALPWVAPIYQGMPSVAEVLAWPLTHGRLQWGLRRSLARQCQGQFDRAYVAPNSLKSALIPWLAGIPERIGYHGESRYGLLTHRLPNPSRAQRPPMVEFYVAMAMDGNTAQGAARQPRLQRPTESVRRSLQAWALEPGAYIVLAAGAEYGPAKQWPVSNAARLCRQLDTPVVLLGTDKDQAFCQQIQTQAASARLLNLAGKTTLEQAMDLVSAARALVSNDSGLMHVAAALGVPQVALFGSSSPHHTPPMSDKAQVIWLADDPEYTPALDCAPCFDRQCRWGHTRCLSDITPERVVKSLSLL